MASEQVLKWLGTVALLTAVLTTASSAAAQKFGDWRVHDDGIATRNESGGMLLFMSGNAGILDSRRCDTDGNYAVMVNLESAWIAKLTCHGERKGSGLYLYTFEDLDTLVDAVIKTKRSTIGFAMPLADGGFVAVRFSLRGFARAATAKWGGEDSKTAPTTGTKDRRLY